MLLNRTRFGRHIYAVGGNLTAAKYSGINTDKTIFLAYVLTGVFSAFGGIILVSRLNSGQPTIGEGAELDAIAACIVEMCIRDRAEEGAEGHAAHASVCTDQGGSKPASGRAGMRTGLCGPDCAGVGKAEAAFFLFPRLTAKDGESRAVTGINRKGALARNKSCLLYTSSSQGFRQGRSPLPSE